MDKHETRKAEKNITVEDLPEKELTAEEQKAVKGGESAGGIYGRACSISRPTSVRRR